LDSDKPWDFDALAGAGAIRSTTADMVRFARAHLDPPDGPIGETLNLAWKQHLEAEGEHFAMGLGWHIARDGSTRWHNGQTGGYHAMILISRLLDAGVVVLSNTATGQVDVIAESIIQSMAGMDVRPKPIRKTVDVEREVMKRLVGRYQLSPVFTLDVQLQNSHLVVQATNQPAVRVYPESETTWHYRVVDAKLVFDLPESGAATSLTLHQHGLQLPAKRVRSP
jgi:CubicO group peptidase (beta-lactamase class C family)